MLRWQLFATLLAVQVWFALMMASSYAFAYSVTQVSVAEEHDRETASLYLPDRFESDPNTLRPLVLNLHGLGSSAGLVTEYFGLVDEVDERDFMLLAPQGLKRRDGNRFWNATDACCAPRDFKPDDVTYLSQLIETVLENYPVQRDMIFVTGHSNGAYMSHRMACDRGDLIRGIVTFAGHVWKDTSLCNPTEPVRVLHLFGTSDSGYEGNDSRPSAWESVEFWANHNRHTARQQLDDISVDALAWGRETIPFEWVGGDEPVVFWLMRGSRHVPFLESNFSSRVLDFLFRE